MVHGENGQLNCEVPPLFGHTFITYEYGKFEAPFAVVSEGGQHFLDVM